MFRSNVFEPTLTSIPYRLFIEGLKSAVTKAAYTFALQKYMKFLKIENPNDLLKYQDNQVYPEPNNRLFNIFKKCTHFIKICYTKSVPCCNYDIL